MFSTDVRKFGIFAIAAFLFSSAVYADNVPQCVAYGRELPVNNEQVLNWKRTTANQFQDRANVSGQVVRLFADRSSHAHFEIQIGPRQGDVLEVVYNLHFGAIPEVQLGMQVQACGDYITATAHTGKYPPSPSGAIIHWIHMNPKNRGHDHGWMMIDGVVYGNDYNEREDERRNPRRNRRGFLPEFPLDLRFPAAAFAN